MCVCVCVCVCVYVYWIRLGRLIDLIGRSIFAHAPPTHTFFPPTAKALLALLLRMLARPLRAGATLLRVAAGPAEAGAGREAGFKAGEAAAAAALPLAAKMVGGLIPLAGRGRRAGTKPAGTGLFRCFREGAPIASASALRFGGEGSGCCCCCSGEGTDTAAASSASSCCGCGCGCCSSSGASAGSAAGAAVVESLLAMLPRWCSLYGAS